MNCAFGNVYSCSRQLLLSVVLGSYLGSHLGNWLNFQCGIFVGRLFQFVILLRKNCLVLKYILNLFPSPGPPPYPILWPTLTQYGLTIVRLVLGLKLVWILPLRKRFCLQSLMDNLTLGGVVGVATRIVFKPTSYLTVCTILQV